MNGVLFEMQGFIDGYLSRYPGMKVVMSGGDLSYFDNRLKISIFANHNLVLQGLNHILDYNATSR
jgi:type III pantothenate kinase